MKKIFLLLVISMFLFGTLTFAQGHQTKASQTMVTFIYINGSNDLSAENRLKFRESFVKDVKKMHPLMQEAFESDDLIQKNFLKNGRYKINPEPVVFYWGDRSLNEIKNIDNGLNSAKKYTPRIAQKVRSLFAHCLHDAIWVQKFTNMEPVIDDLQKVVKAETDKGNRVVLLGYSAGSFITYQYFLNKFTSIVPKEMISNKDNSEIQEIVENNPVEPTCLDALIEADLVRLNTSGKFYPNNDIEVIRKNYPTLDEKTQMACFKSDAVKGVVNFASPLILFYSNVTDASTSINFLSQLMVKNIVENDIFFLTVNYRNDPLGFPNAENINLKQIKASDSILAKYFKSGNGFIYNKSDLYVPRTFITAHMSYWTTPKRFVKGVVDAYNDGFANFHGLTCD